LLGNGNTAACNVSHEKNKMSRNDGAICVKETIWDCAIGKKSRFVGHRFLKQAKNLVSDGYFRNNAIAL